MHLVLRTSCLHNMFAGVLMYRKGARRCCVRLSPYAQFCSSSCSSPCAIPLCMVTIVHIIILTWRSLWQPTQNNSAGTVTERERERVKKSNRVKEKKNNWGEKKRNAESWEEGRQLHMKGPFKEAKKRHFHFRGERRVVVDGWWVPGPVGLKEGWVIDDKGQQYRKRPQQEGWEELGNDRALDWTAKLWINETEKDSNVALRSHSSTRY